MSGTRFISQNSSNLLKGQSRFCRSSRGFCFLTVSDAPPNYCASQFAASLIAVAAFLRSSMVIAISLIFDIYCPSFLGLSM